MCEACIPDSKTIDNGLIFSRSVDGESSREYCSFNFVELDIHFVPSLLLTLECIYPF